MQIKTVRSFSERKKADVLIVPCWIEGGQARLAQEVPHLKRQLELPLHIGDFKAKEGSATVLYPGELPESRTLLIGLGKKEDLNPQALRLGYGAASRKCAELKAASINVLLPALTKEQESKILRGAFEGLFFANYAFTQLKGDSLKDEPVVLLEKVTFIGATAAHVKLAERTQIIGEGMSLARDLVNSNADDLPPPAIAAKAKELAKELENLKVTTFDKKRIEKEGMGLLLAVNRGSSHDPAFIILEYQGKPASAERTVILGKGMTYDTGGLNIKPTGSMETMKTDMSGAAACLGTVYAVAALKLPINLTAVIPSAENSVDAHSYKPGDIYRSYSGKTVEIGNTDAEGRLILADALAYASAKLKPTRMIDLATLTGAIVIALGEEVAGLMANDEKLAQDLIKAGLSSGESVWQMPLPESYRKMLKSELADIRNIGGRPGSAITAALFLKEFVGKGIPWAHLDIAGTAYPDKPVGFHPVRATGFGVRLLVDYLEGLKS